MFNQNINRRRLIQRNRRRQFRNIRLSPHIDTLRRIRQMAPQNSQDEFVIQLFCGSSFYQENNTFNGYFFCKISHFFFRFNHFKTKIYFPLYNVLHLFKFESRLFAQDYFSNHKILFFVDSLPFFKKYTLILHPINVYILKIFEFYIYLFLLLVTFDIL